LIVPVGIDEDIFSREIYILFAVCQESMPERYIRMKAAKGENV
jgi:hypothetical protein